MSLENFSSGGDSYKDKLKNIKEGILNSLKSLRKSVEDPYTKEAKGLKTKDRLGSIAMHEVNHFGEKFEKLMDSILSRDVLDDAQRHALEVQLVNAFDHAMHEYFAGLQRIYSQKIDSNEDHVRLNEDLQKWMNISVEMFLDEDFSAMPEEIKKDLSALFDQSIPAGVQDLMHRVDASPNTLKTEDLQSIARLSSGAYSGDRVIGSLGLLTLEKLDTNSLYRTFEVSLDDPHWGKMLLDQVIQGRLSIPQGQALVELALKYKNAQPEYSRKIRKSIEAKIEDLEALKKVINSEDLKKLQVEFLANKAKQAQEMTKTFGHRNHANTLFSLKGVAGTVGFLMGGVGLALNVLTGNVMNKANVWNLALMGGAAEMTDGLGGLLPTPRKLLNSLLAGKNTQDKERVLAEWNAFEVKISGEKNLAQCFLLESDIFKALENVKDEKEWPSVEEILSPKHLAYWEKTLNLHGAELTKTIHEFYKELKSFELGDAKNYASFMDELHQKSRVKMGLSNHETILNA